MTTGAADVSWAAQAFLETAYGDDPSHRMDIYLPEGDGPHPWIMGIHGGGWMSGDKQHMIDFANVPRIVGLGVAMACVTYRFIPQAAEQGVFPPVMGPMGDAKLALQFLRLNAERWNLDPERVALYGGSAGACSALWLGLAPDRAEPNSDDPVLRQSTKVRAIGCAGAQTSLDPVQMRQWVGEALTYGGHAFGCNSFDEFLKRREELMEHIRHTSPAAQIHPGSPPIHLFYGFGLEPEEPTGDYFTHSPRFGLGLAELARPQGVTCNVSYPGQGPDDPDARRDKVMDALIAAVA